MKKERQWSVKWGEQDGEVEKKVGGMEKVGECKGV